jgi:hypothetical protein
MVENNDNIQQGMKTTGRGVEDTIKENREECMLMER